MISNSKKERSKSTRFYTYQVNKILEGPFSITLLLSYYVVLNSGPLFYDVIRPAKPAGMANACLKIRRSEKKCPKN